MEQVMLKFPFGAWKKDAKLMQLWDLLKYDLNHYIYRRVCYMELQFAISVLLSSMIECQDVVK